MERSISNKDNRYLEVPASRNSLVEAQIPQGEDELRAIIDNAPVFLWSNLPDGYCDFLNHPWLTYFNLSLQEAQGAGWATRIHPDDAARHMESWKKSVSAGVPFESEARFRRADGEYRWFLTRANPLRDETGKIIKWYGTNIDIGDLKRTEQRLRQSEAYLTEAQRLSHTGTAVYNETAVLYWSEETYRIWGFDPLEGLPSLEAVMQRVHPDDLDTARGQAERALRDKRGHSIAYRIVLPDGMTKHLESMSHPVFSASGDLVEIVATQVDVTERKRAQQALLERETKIRRLVDANIIGILIWDIDGRIIEANDAFLHMVDYDRDDLVSGRIRWTELTPAEWREWDERALAELRSTATFQPFEKEYVRKDGGRVPVLIGGVLFEEGGNEGVAFILDLTERKKAEDRLRRSQAYLAEAQRLSHTGTWVLNPTTMQYLYWSDESYRIWGFDPLQGPPSRDALWQRIHDRDRVWEKVQEALRQKKDYSGEFKIVLPDGTVKYLAATSHHLFSTDGELVEVIGTNVDVTERRRAEEALRESEYELRQIFETVPAFLWSAKNLASEPTNMNRRLLDYFGKEFEDFQHGGWKAFLHPDDLPETAKALSHAVQTETSFRTVHRLRRADGEFRWHDARGEPVRDRQGNIIQWYGLSVDIEEAKKAEDQLRRSEAYLTEAQRLSHTGTWVLNATTMQYLYWSDEGYRIWAFDPLQGLPSRETMWQRIHPDDRDRVWEKIQEALRQKKDYSGEFRIVLPNGTVKYLSATSHHLFSTNGELVEVISTNVDVTERKCAELALRESEVKFRDYAETASDWFWETDPDYRFTVLTNNAFGSAAANRIGTRCWDHALDLETEPEKWRLLQATYDSREAFRDFVYCTMGGNGSRMYVSASGKPVFDASGEFRGYRGTCTDVTAFVRAQEERERLRQLESDLAHMNRLSVMGELAASLAHEITQPIATARNNARAAVNFLNKQPPDLAEVSEALDCIVADADRAGDIIDRIRDHMKKAPPRKCSFDLNEAINEVIGLARSEIAKNGVSVQTRLAEGLLPVMGDRVQLQQVVMNLILNAVEAMSSVETGTRELSISTEPHQAGGVLVRVLDSGPGIDPKDLGRVFEAFYTTKGSGVGIGLSICRSIIDAHAGRLWAEVNTPRGAAFQFTLPSAKKELMNSLQAADQNGRRHEDTVPDPSHQPAYEDNKQRRRSTRARDQNH